MVINWKGSIKQAPFGIRSDRSRYAFEGTARLHHMAVRVGSFQEDSCTRRWRLGVSSGLIMSMILDCILMYWLIICRLFVGRKISTRMIWVEQKYCTVDNWKACSSCLSFCSEKILRNCALNNTYALSISTHLYIVVLHV
jgi:hypothetical protein